MKGEFIALKMLVTVTEVVFSTLITVMSATGKLLINVLYWCLWILFHFTLGILGLEDRSTSAFSWLMLIIVLFLYCDGHNYDWYSALSRPIALCKYLQVRLGLQQYHGIHEFANYNDVLLENQINDYREAEPLTMQLEAENRENENEENDLVEADRHRIDNDNRMNVELENGHNNFRVHLENRQNVERERRDFRMSRENQRNQTRYFLRQRIRNQNNA